MTYYHSSNILGFTTSGTERVRIDTTGAKFSENFGSTDDVLHIAPSNGGNRTMTIDGQKIDVTFTNSGGSAGLELQGNGGATTFGGAVSGITTLTTSSSITTGYGVAFTNGNTNFLQYNNAGEDVLYLRDTTNGAMLLTYGTDRTTIHKNTRHSDQVEFEDTNAVINRVSGDLEIRTYGGYDINLMPAGNVGIGTTTPSEKLDIRDGELVFTHSSLNQASSGTIRFNEYNGDNVAGSYMRYNGSSNSFHMYLNNESTDYEFLRATRNSHLVLQSGGNNVGIGTSTPSNLLHLDGTYPQLRLNASGDTTYTTFGSGTSFAVFNIVNPSTKTYEFRNNGTAQLTIDTSGNVGIGTASPGYKLSVENELNVFSSGDTASPKVEGHLLRVTDTTNDNPDIEHFFVENHGLAYGMRWLYDGGANTFSLFRHDNSASGNEVLRFNRANSNVYIPGNVGIGVTSPSFSYGSLGLEIQSTGDTSLRLERDGSTAFEISARSSDVLIYNPGTARNFRFGIGGTEEFRMDTSGNFHADADVIAFSTTTASDIKFKENVKSIPYGLKEVLQMNPVEFDWIEKRDGQHDIGFIAQEMEKIVPEVIKETETLEVGGTHKTMDYAKLTSILVQAIQEQQEQINELKEKLNG